MATIPAPDCVVNGKRSSSRSRVRELLALWRFRGKAAGCSYCGWQLLRCGLFGADLQRGEDGVGGAACVVAEAAHFFRERLVARV